MTQAQPAALASALAGVVRPGDVLFVGTGAAEPTLAIEALVQLSAEVAPLHVLQVMTGSEEALAAASGPRLRLHCIAPGRRSRKALAEGRAEPVLASMAQLRQWIVDGTLAVDGALLQAGPTDDPRFGWPGLAVDVAPAAFEAARYRVVELNSQLPHVDCDIVLDLDRCDHIVRVDREPPDFPPRAPSDVSLVIGERLAEVVSDGETLEVGVGRALLGLSSALAGRRRRLSIHTGLVSDWLRDLVEAETVERPLGCANEAVALATVVVGSRSFHRWLERTSALRLADSAHVHDVGHLAALKGFVAINSAIEVDLLGQTNSVRHDGRVVGSPGGLIDFACAGAHQRGSIIALEATRRDGSSTIVPTVESVTLPGQLVTHVVTEFGIARLSGKSLRERAKELLGVADPGHRELLAHEARRAGVL